MAITTILWIVLAVGLGVSLLAPAVLAIWRKHRKPPELRGDWWPRFESDFRAYAKHAANRKPPELRADWWPRFESEFRTHAKHAAKPARETRRRTPDSKPPPR